MADNSNWNTDPAENVEIDGALVDDGVSESWSLVRAVKSIMSALSPGADVEFNSVNFGGSDLSSYVDWTAFTPVVADASTAGNTGTFTSTSEYSRIGDTIYFEISLINIVTTGMTSGNTLYIRGLPFAAKIGRPRVCTCLTEQVTLAGHTVVGSIDGGQSYIRLRTLTTGTASAIVKVSALTSGTADIYLSGFYQV